jgi:hypothetical protein
VYFVIYEMCRNLGLVPNGMVPYHGRVPETYQLMQIFKFEEVYQKVLVLYGNWMLWYRY